MLKLSSRRPTHAAGPAGRRGRHLFTIQKDLLVALGDRDGQFAVLITGFRLLLHRYGEPDDIGVAGKNESGETLLLRTGMADNPTFAEALNRTRNAIQTPDKFELEACGALLVVSSDTQEDYGGYDSVLALRESEEGLAGILEYNADGLGQTQALAFVNHFENLLKEAVARPHDRVSSFEMLGAVEKRRMLVDWNGDVLGYPPYCAHELFEQQVERTPDAVAAVFEGSQLSYRDLNGRANQLAHYLRKKGAGPETPLGVLLDSSFEIVVAVIAILKSGGAYVALDRREAAHRLREVIEDSGLRLIVTASSDARYPEIAGEWEARLDFVCVDRDASPIAGESSFNPVSGAGPDNMAFLRYTSGSTGRPKAAVNIHRAITSRLISLPMPEMSPSDVCMVNPSWGFGARLFHPLILGASIAIVREEDVRDPSRLADSLERNGITSIFVVPSHLRQLLSIGGDLGRRLRLLRTVTVGGETVTPDLVARFRELLPQAQLFNNYGGAEVGGTATSQLVDPDSPMDANCIGRPVVNTCVYILDRDMNPVPQGAVGEICVASEHIAREYLHRPELTEARFVRDPFATRENARLCRTGDLGRVLPDGRIEFLGRADRQIKIRGFRVELDEVEAVLQDHDQVNQAVVTAQKSGGANRLVAYVVPLPSATLSAGVLQKFLRDRLPDYMIPPVFVLLDRFPLNKNGKVDSTALPLPGPERPNIDSLYLAPRNPLETSIAEIWSEVLGLEKIGVYDNFIELGGDSLLATGVSARIRQRLDFEVPMDLILQWDIARIAAGMMAAAN